jgi:hypothetical protein
MEQDLVPAVEMKRLAIMAPRRNYHSPPSATNRQSTRIMLSASTTYDSSNN